MYCVRTVEGGSKLFSAMPALEIVMGVLRAVYIPKLCCGHQLPSDGLGTLQSMLMLTGRISSSFRTSQRKSCPMGQPKRRSKIEVAALRWRLQLGYCQSKSCTCLVCPEGRNHGLRPNVSFPQPHVRERSTSTYERMGSSWILHLQGSSNQSLHREQRHCQPWSLAKIVVQQLQRQRDRELR